MGENITTRELDLLNLPAGARLHIGDEAVVEGTGLRNPCEEIAGIQPGLLQSVLERDEHGDFVRKVGVVSVALEGGEVRPGDPIRVELPSPPHQQLEPV